MEALGPEAPGPGDLGARAERERPRRTVRLDVEYDGAGFSGWQRQAEDRTVQAVIEEALARVLAVPTRLAGAGRTDAGVHALCMTASFDTDRPLPARDLHRALDAVLPEDVGVLDVRDEAPGFHALRDARWKWYRYAWLRSRYRRVHERRTSWLVPARLDVDAMRAAASALLGRRDFASFQSSGSPRRTTVRTVAGLELAEDGEALRLDVLADGFLYGMVRAIAGTLTEVGRGARRVEDLPAVLAARSRAAAGPAAPAHGLTLVRVGYRGDELPPFVASSLRTALESRQPPQPTKAPGGERA